MTLEFLNRELSVCKYAQPIFPDGDFVFVGKTDREFSLVCETAYVPDGWTERDDGWAAFRIVGQLDFSLIGILSRIAGILADEKISMFALSTYDTDYFLIKRENKGRTLEALRNHGYDICR